MPVDTPGPGDSGRTVRIVEGSGRSADFIPIYHDNPREGITSGDLEAVAAAARVSGFAPTNAPPPAAMEGVSDVIAEAIRAIFGPRLIGSRQALPPLVARRARRGGRSRRAPRSSSRPPYQVPTPPPVVSTQPPGPMGPPMVPSGSNQLPPPGETETPVDLGDIFRGGVEGAIGGLIGELIGAPPAHIAPVDLGGGFTTGPAFGGGPATMADPYTSVPAEVTVNTRTGAVTKCRRRRRRRLLTPTDLSDLAALQALVGKGSAALNMAVAKAVRR